MKTLLYLTCLICTGSYIYYLGINWWVFPIFVASMTTVKFLLDPYSEGVSAVKESAFLLLWFAGLYVLILVIYAFAGEGEIFIRAWGFLKSSDWFGMTMLYLIGGYLMLILFGPGGDGYSGGYREEYYEDNQAPKNYMSPDDLHFRRTQDELNRQHQEAEDMGYFK